MNRSARTGNLCAMRVRLWSVVGAVSHLPLTLLLHAGLVSRQREGAVIELSRCPVTTVRLDTKANAGARRK